MPWKNNWFSLLQLKGTFPEKWQDTRLCRPTWQEIPVAGSINYHCNWEQLSLVGNIQLEFQWTTPPNLLMIRFPISSQLKYVRESGINSCHTPHQLPVNQGLLNQKSKKQLFHSCRWNWTTKNNKNIKHKWKSTKKQQEGVFHIPMKCYSHRQANLSVSLQSLNEFIGWES
jgi:hypothetical protein